MTRIDEPGRLGGETDPKKVVERYVDEVLNGKNLAAANELISNVTFRQRGSALLSAFPDLEVSTRVLIAEDHLVACHVSARGTHRGAFQGMPATGKRWMATCSALYEVRDGRISDFWVNWDLLAIMEQIGAVARTEGASA